MADDLQAELLGWVLDELDKQRFGEDYAAAVSLGAAQMGNRMIPLWQLLLAARSPLLGQGPLYHFVPLGGARPEEADVRAAVADGLRQLRDLAASKLAGSNGKAPARTVPG